MSRDLGDERNDAQESLVHVIRLRGWIGRGWLLASAAVYLTGNQSMESRLFKVFTHQRKLYFRDCSVARVRLCVFVRAYVSVCAWLVCVHCLVSA